MHELICGTGNVLLYFLVLASSALLIRRCTKVPDEPFRKFLHCILLGSLLVWTMSFHTWQLAALSVFLFVVVVYPALAWAEHLPGFSHLLTERKKGELKNSLVLVFTMFLAVLVVCWGWLDDKYLALASVYAWGFGDAAAALVGKRFGRHHLTGKHIEGRKSVEGTLAMFVVSCLSVALVLTLRGGLTWPTCLVISVITGAVSAVVELFSLNGRDTFYCPLAAMAVLLPLLHILGGGV
ncbi:MAG: phosphatidate cytidylyltransferase [Ruminiclostridium sp.]|nr:phosphatidate cytidylyltransferase [Ruminiclostridium sp.]